MKTTLLVGIVLLSAATLALVPAGEARQACIHPDSDPCDDHLVCVWNRLTAKWDCYVRVYHPCDPTRCDPTIGP